MILYNKTKTQVIGRLTDGKIVPTTPIPTGDAFDDLLHECCQAVGLSSRLKNRTTFAPDIDKSSGRIIRHSWKLAEEVTRWIREGDCRSYTQVNTAVNTLADHWDRFVRLGIIPSWKLDWGELQYLRGMFGVSDGKPLPSKQEYLAEKAAREAKEAKRIRESNIARQEEKAEMDEHEAKLVRQERAKRLIKTISDKLWAFDKINFNLEPLSDEYRVLSEKRKKFRREAIPNGIDTLIARSGKTDVQIMEEIMQFEINELVSLGESVIPPLGKDVTRRFFTLTELHEFISNGWGEVLDTHDTVLMKGTDSLFVLDITPREHRAIERANASVTVEK